MLQNFLRSFVTFLVSIPAALGTVFTVREAANKVGFDKVFPATNEKLVSALNSLIYVLVEYCLGYVLLCLLAAYIWALIVSEPKSQSKRRLEQRRQKLRR